MILNKNFKFRSAVYMVLILTAGFVRAIMWRIGLAHHGFISLIYLTVYFIWLCGIRRRFLQKDMRRILTAAALLMIFLIIIRFLKYDIVPNGTLINRHLWYYYYIPFTLLPLLMFHAALHIGKPDNSNVSPYWKLSYIPAACVMIGIVTNDFHQLAFCFCEGIDNYNEKYTRGIFYYAAVAIFAFSLAGILIIVFKTCVKRRLLNKLWLSGIVILMGAVYLHLYVFEPDSKKALIQMMYEVPEFICLFLIAFWESLVITHLIPSNTNHELIFRTSSVRAGLTDHDYQVCIKSKDSIVPTPQQIKNAETGTDVTLENGKTLLKSQPVQGGHFYWLEDISELDKLNKQLIETGDYLVEENAILEAETKIEEDKKRTEEQTRLYNHIAHSLKPALDKLSEILENLPQSEEEFRQTMKYAAVINAYIKRKSNLMLLAGTDQHIKTDELRISVEESFEYLRLSFVICGSDIVSGYTLPSEMVLFLYELFEDSLELAMPAADAVFVTLNINNHVLKFYMEFSSPTAELPIDRYRTKAEKYKGRITKERSDNCQSITFQATLGGDRSC
ncbi:MAG: hypothetical protein IJ192_03395 [Clostridia bacterium]|nr:hypothetical protein [Clostridia bacterium]MBR2176844.1 hypothetical protein [Clostridia bacterium]